jgi:NAD+ kinase
MKFAIIGNIEKEGILQATLRLARKLAASGMEFVVERKIADLAEPGSLLSAHVEELERCLEGAGMVVAFGGDGTILWAARVVGARGTPILGVNLGKLGFLAEFSPDDIEQAITDLAQGRYRVEERLALEATRPAEPGRTFSAVNDFVLDKARSSRLIDVEVSIDGAFAVTYRGDGLIVSTPTGSTAYALSNGGPIITPSSDVIGITPISPHTLGGRPLIVPSSSEIRIVAHAPGGEVLFSADGQEEALLTPPAEVVVRTAPFPLRLVRRTDRTYYDVLRAKLLWGQDPRG